MPACPFFSLLAAALVVSATDSDLDSSSDEHTDVVKREGNAVGQSRDPRGSENSDEFVPTPRGTEAAGVTALPESKPKPEARLKREAKQPIKSTAPFKKCKRGGTPGPRSLENTGVLACCSRSERAAHAARPAPCLSGDPAADRGPHRRARGRALRRRQALRGFLRGGAGRHRRGLVRAGGGQ